MFRVFVIKKRYIGLCVLIALCIFIISFVGKLESKETMALPLDGKIILIDPGHGGIDAGAVANGVVEKELNLEIAKILQMYIEESGGVAILTRIDDSNTADPDREKNLSQKMSDLKERKKDIDDFEADVFISIHMNKFEQSKYRGAQVFYSDDEKGESKKLGELIQQTIKETVGDDNNRKPKPSGTGIFILKNNTVPSVLVECGFLSNPDEAALLKNKEYQRKIAWGIYTGLIKYLNR